MCLLDIAPGQSKVNQRGCKCSNEPAAANKNVHDNDGKIKHFTPRYSFWNVKYVSQLPCHKKSVYLTFWCIFSLHLNVDYGANYPCCTVIIKEHEKLDQTYATNQPVFLKYDADSCLCLITQYSAISEYALHYAFIHFHQTCPSPPQLSLGIHEKFFQALATSQLLNICLIFSPTIWFNTPPYSVQWNALLVSLYNVSYDCGSDHITTKSITWPKGVLIPGRLCFSISQSLASSENHLQTITQVQTSQINSPTQCTVLHSQCPLSAAHSGISVPLSWELESITTLACSSGKVVGQKTGNFRFFIFGLCPNGSHRSRLSQVGLLSHVWSQ